MGNSKFSIYSSRAGREASGPSGRGKGGSGGSGPSGLAGGAGRGGRLGFGGGPPVSPKVTILRQCVESVEPHIKCGRCNRRVDISRTQIVGKCPGVYRCNTCNTRAVQLSRLPAWRQFSAKLKRASPEDRQKFWEGAAGANGVERLKAFLEEKESIVNKFSETNTKTERGEYLPLGVWKRRGFSTKRIKENCTDVIEDPILGKCYRVFIAGAECSATESKEISEVLSKGSASSGAPPVPQDPSRGSGKPGGGVPPEGPTPKQLQAVAGLASRILAKIGVVLVPMQAYLDENP